MIDSFVFILVVVVLLGLDFLLIAARTGFLQTSHARLLTTSEGVGEQANRAIRLLQSIHRVKGTLNLSLTLIRFILAGMVLFFTLSQPLLAPEWVAVGALALSALLLFWYDWTIERLVARNPEAWALRMATLVGVLTRTLGLLVLPFDTSGENQGGGEGLVTVTEDEVKVLVDAGEEEGIFEQGERRMIFSIFQLGDTLAREIMVPRIDVLALDVHTPVLEAVDALLQSGHSRVPVYEETIDRTLGLLYAKDLLAVWREGSQVDSLRSLLRQAYFVPEAKKVDELLAEMQNQRIHMAIVVDEYGGVAGLVTLEDIVEEILGEIQDEYDQGEELPFQALKTGEYLFQGKIDLDDFNEIMSSDLPVAEADTLGGFIYSRIGRVPTVGETVRQDNLLLTVEQVSGRRIRKVRAQKLSMEASDGELNDEANG